MPNNRSVVNVKPSNYGVLNVKPSNQRVGNVKPLLSNLLDNIAVYTETKTILKGSPIANGFFMFLTYPSQLVFIATRS